MKRRTFIGAAAGVTAAAASGLPVPALGQGAAARTLRIVPQANLTSLDPAWTTATITRTHSFLVYDAILAVDSNFQVKPQLADGGQIEDDGRTHIFTLRDGQRFHNGEPVRAQDCVASIKRWWGRDGFGQEIAKRHDRIDAPNLDEQKHIATEIQVEAFQVVPHVPLGHFLSPSAMRRNVTGRIRSPVVLFYNMAKTA